MKPTFLTFLFIVLSGVCETHAQAEPTPAPTPNDIPVPMVQPAAPSATPAARMECPDGTCGMPGTADKAPEPAENVEATLTQLEQDWGEAIVNHDVAFLERTESDDYIYTGPDGVVTHKADEIAGAKAGFVRIDSFKHSDIKVQVYGDTAVVTGATTLKGIAGDVDLSGDFRWTDVFVKQGGHWRVIASQATPMSKPEPES